MGLGSPTCSQLACAVITWRVDLYAFCFTILGRRNVSQLDAVLFPIRQSDERDSSTSHKACSDTPVFLQTFTLILSTLITFLTVASIRTSSIGFGFIILGRG